ncbi:MAG: DNA-binding transcriptional LysR family regulator, partial [Thermoproteota archaeon]
MLNNIDLSKIRIFNEVYKCLNIHRASENLQITPSAVSQTLKNLELELGEQLFVRTRQKIIATELGEAFFEKIIPLAVGLEQGLENFYENMGELQGQLSI